MTLTDGERARLAVLAALMVPGGAGMPGWAGLGLEGAAVDHVLATEPRWGPPMRRFLAQEGPVRSLAEVETLAQADPEGFRALGVVVANAWFMDPRVRAAIGYPGQEARDSSIGLTPACEALVAEVAARGPVFRPA